MKVRRLLLAALAALLVSALGFAGGFRIGTQLGAAPRPTPIQGAALAYELPAAPMDLEIVGGSGYMSLADGQILLVTVEGDDVQWTQAASGLAFPRGLAVTDDTVYVVALGSLPCVRGEDNCPDDDAEREVHNIEAADARLLALPIRPDGSLGSPATLIEGMPVVSRDHAPNDVELGPDGALYVSVGGVDYLWRDPAIAERIDRPHPDWLGTILRVEPSTGATRVWARGIRNVYGLTFSEDGRLFAVDNDGPTANGWRHEELLEITEGANFGYPFDGTMGPFRQRTDFPIYALDSVGDAGIAWLGGGVAVGGCGRLQSVPFIDGAGGSYEVRTTRFVDDLARVPGCATAVVLTDDALLVTVFGPPDGIMVVPIP